MSVPKFDEFMKPMLEYLPDKKEHKTKELQEFLGEHFHLSDEDRQELLPGSGQLAYKNRIGWASTYLKKAGLIANPARSVIQITEKGLKVIRDNPSVINAHYLTRFSDFKAFFTPSVSIADAIKNNSQQPGTPETQFEQA